MVSSKYILCSGLEPNMWGTNMTERPQCSTVQSAIIQEDPGGPAHPDSAERSPLLFINCPSRETARFLTSDKALQFQGLVDIAIWNVFFNLSLNISLAVGFADNMAISLNASLNISLNFSLNVSFNVSFNVSVNLTSVSWHISPNLATCPFPLKSFPSALQLIVSNSRSCHWY